MLGKLNRYLTIFSIPLILAALIAGTAGCDGTPPAQICDWYDLDAVRDNLGGSYILMNDLDSTTAGYAELAGPTANGGKGWQPIASRYWDDEEHVWAGDMFQGTLDGQGYDIKGLFTDRSEEHDIGLFGSVGAGGTIRNIGVVNAGINGDAEVGGLVGRNYGTVTSCYVTGNVTGNYWVGGLAGHNGEGIVSGSYSAGSVTGNRAVGGLVGDNEEGIVSGSYFVGSVIGSSYVGGLMGFSWGTVSNSYYDHNEVLINGENIITIGALFSADFEEWLANEEFLDVNERLSEEDGYYLINDISDFKQLMAFGQNSTLKFRLTNDLDLATEPNLYIPYLAGEFDGNGHRISNLSFNFDFISQVGLFGHLAPGGKVANLGVENVDIIAYCSIGGVVGFNEGTMNNLSSTGSVIGITNVGGLAGANAYYGTVSNSYSTGSVTGNYSFTGGLVGGNEGTVINSSFSGSATGSYWVGGLVGFNAGTASNSYSVGSVTGNNHVGGLVGVNEGTVSNS
jgi:hypothetical protein